MRGRPSTGQVREIRIPDDLWNVIGLEADIHGISRAQLVRGILGEWVDNGYGRGHRPRWDR